jgi:hypothetical protein
MNLPNDILKIIDDQNFRSSFSTILEEITEVESSGTIVLDMLKTYYSSTPGAGDRDMVLPRGYTLHIKKRGGFFLSHPYVDVLLPNKVLVASVPNYLLYFIRRRKGLL